MAVVVDSILTVKFDELSPKAWEQLEKKLTYVTEAGEVVQGFRKLIYKGVYKLPRGAWALLPDSIRYHDRRTCPKLAPLDFNVELDAVEKDPRFEGQSAAVKAMFENEQGLIVRAPGTGKTQIALAFAAKSRTRVLVVVHTEDILQQWVRYIENSIPELEGEVGIVRGQTERVRPITIATVQTLQKFLGRKKWWDQWGAIIADEAHHVAAPSWQAVMQRCPARYRFGFTASPTRADGMHPTMRFIVGPVIHRQKFSSPVELYVRPVKTGFRFNWRGPFDWTRLVNTLVINEKRNQMIAEKVARNIEAGNSVLVLSRRIEHLERIAALIPHDTEILAAATRSTKDRKRILQEFRDGTVSCVLATQLADEALDVPRLNRVHLVYPGKHEGRIIQQIGRAIRQHPSKKKAVIYDYVDDRVKPLGRQWRSRKATYKKEGISVKATRRLKWRA